METIVKMVSASDAEMLVRLEQAYGAIVPAGIRHAPSIEVAGAAKAVENTQRGLNIARPGRPSPCCAA